jgi:multidrug efflux pump subunit AcrA (membrane-fusion protein)
VKRLVLALALLAAIGAGIFLVLRGRVGGMEVPTLELAASPFLRRITAEGNLRAVKATPLPAPPDAQGALKVAWMLPDGATVKKGDLVVRFDPTEMEKMLADGEADRQSADTKIDKERMQVDTALRGRDRGAQLARDELAQTRTFAGKDPQIFSRSQIIEAQIDESLSGARLSHADGANTSERRISKSKLDLLAIERKKAEITVGQARTGLAALTIQAPHAGLVVFERDWRGNPIRVGDSVWPGQRLAQIPLLGDMEAEVFVLEADAGGLEKGGPADVRLEARPERVWKSKVKRIDTLAKPRLREVPIQYFAVVLELERTEPDLGKPGQRVAATLLHDGGKVIAVPRQAVFDKDGKPVMNRRSSGSGRGAKFEPVPVKLGSSSPARRVLEEGVRAGDHIALADPTRPLDAPKKPAEGAAKPAGAGP